VIYEIKECGDTLLSLIDLWLLSFDGTEIYHAKQVDDPNRNALVDGFFKGLEQFASEMGGSTVFSIKNENSVIIGIKFSYTPTKENLFLIGQFNLTQKAPIKKFESKLNAITHELINQKILGITEKEKIKQKTNEIIKEEFKVKF
jgi:hypothetical protein